jgi:hypothetical protein
MTQENNINNLNNNNNNNINLNNHHSSRHGKVSLQLSQVTIGCNCAKHNGRPIEIE